MRRRSWVAFVGAAVLTSGCASNSTTNEGITAPPVSLSATPDTTSAATTGSRRATTTEPTTTEPATSTSRRPTTTTSTTQPPTTTAPTTTTTLDGLLVGHSVMGRPITLIHRGTPGGVKVLVIGVIHGNEDAGAAIAEDLRDIAVPDGVELFVVPSMNPDGQADQRRTNAHLVDLNRNFPYGWAPLGQPGDGQYSGTGPASEPETQAIVDLINMIQPDLAIWYHQDLHRIAPAKGKPGRVRKRYADLTGLPIEPITGGTYTGTAANFGKNALPLGVSFIVELGPTLSAGEALTHATAVLTVASELRSL